MRYAAAVTSALAQPTRPARPDTTIESWIRQRAVASAIQGVFDLFSEHMDAAAAIGERLKARGKADSPQEAIVNAMRPFALGAVVRLGYDLGLQPGDLYGQGKGGRTEILDLAGFHRTSIGNAVALFDALKADRGEFGLLVEARYQALLRVAKREVDAEERARRLGRYASKRAG